VLDTNGDPGGSSNYARALVFGLVVERGIAGAALTCFIMAMEWNRPHVDAYLGVAGLSVWAFAVHWYFGWGKRVFILLGPPSVNLFLCLGWMAGFWPYLGWCISFLTRFVGCGEPSRRVRSPMNSFASFASELTGPS
jgi:hypothetical protein